MTLGYEAFDYVAKKLGLRLDPPHQQSMRAEQVLTGVVDGLSVHVRQWYGQFVHVDFTAYLSPPVDLRLHVEQANLGSKLGHLFGRHDIEVGDADFDAAFDIKADEPERARALFSPELRRVLLPWKDVAVRMWITDEAVRYRTIPGAYSTTSGPDLERNLLAVVALARAIGVAMAGVPSSAILAPHVEAWSAYAQLRALDFTPSPLSVTGTLEGSRFTARAAATDDHEYGTHVELRFAERLPWELRVRPARFFDFLERGDAGAHLVLGDAELDKELRVTTTDETRARAFLDEDVRAALRDLHRDEGDVMLDAQGLSVRTKRMTDPAGFSRIVERVAAVARKLAERAGPYR